MILLETIKKKIFPHNLICGGSFTILWNVRKEVSAVFCNAVLNHKVSHIGPFKQKQLN